MGTSGYESDDGTMTIRPHLGIGWQTTVDRASSEVAMQLRLFRWGLPIRRRIARAEVVRIAAVSRESWWSRAGGYMVFPRNLASSGEGTRPDRMPMPTKGWRYDILMTLKAGKTIKIDTVKSPQIAKDLERRLRGLLGLPAVH